MAYGDFKDLNRRTTADKVLCDKAFNFAKNLKYNGYQHGLAAMVYKFCDKKTSGWTVMKLYLAEELYLTEELNKQLLEHLEKEKYIHLL